MSAMVERVAKKYAETRGCALRCYDAGVGCMCYLEALTFVREMREPTNNMQLAGWAPIHTTGAAIAEHIWIAMIDAALNEP